MKSTRSTDNTERRIDEELVLADSLKHSLCTCCACKKVVIHRGRHDPPDFTVTIEGERLLSLGEVDTPPTGKSIRSRTWDEVFPIFVTALFENLLAGFARRLGAKCSLIGLSV